MAYTAEDMKKEKGRGYANGYAAGQKRNERELASLQRELARLKRERVGAVQYNQAYCAALSGLVTSTTWKLNDKPAASTADYAQIAKHAADASMKHMKPTP